MGRKLGWGHEQGVIKGRSGVHRAALGVRSTAWPLVWGQAAWVESLLSPTEPSNSPSVTVIRFKRK